MPDIFAQIEMPVFSPLYDPDTEYGYKKSQHKKNLQALLNKTSEGFCMYCYVRVAIDGKLWGHLEHSIEKKNSRYLTECVPNIAWACIAIIGVWSIIGYNMVLFLGGLQEIPGDYYEAARIDGASGIRQFFSITMPLLSPTTFFIVQTRIIGALTIFDLMFMVMDKTNQALNKTQSIVYVFYQYSFTNGNKGVGAAIVVILLVFIMILTVILQKLEKKLVYHN